MHPETSKPVWSRRAFLTRAGAGGLAVAGWTALKTLPQAEAAEQKAKLVVTWNAYDTMDPHVKQDVSAAAFNLNLYDNLLRYQSNPPEIVPWLAESHSVGDDGKTWTFHLRRGVKFHDGSALTAEAVRFSGAHSPPALGLSRWCHGIRVQSGQSQRLPGQSQGQNRPAH